MRKLGDIHGDEAIDVAADLLDPIMVLADDPDMKELFRQRPVPEGQTARGFGAARVGKHLTAAIKNQRDAFIRILAVIDGITENEYKDNVNPIKLYADALEVLNDPEFQTLFFSSAQTSADAASGAGLEITQDQNE